MDWMENNTFDGISVQETAGKGKGLFAAKKFEEGDDIFTEKPFILCQFSWSKFYNYTACDFCMKSMETPQNMCRRLTTNYDLELPYHEQLTKKIGRDLFTKCPDCDAPYCCIECMDKAQEKYHKVLCLKSDKNSHPINELENAWRNMHFPPESATIMLALRIIAMFIQAEDSETLRNIFDGFVHSVSNTSDRFSHKLLGEKFQDQINEIYLLLKKAISFERIPMLSTVSGLHTLLALIGMNAQGIGTSSLSKYVHDLDEFRENELSEEESNQIDAFIDKIYDDIDKEVGEFINCEGSGLYITQSKCNHSCEPNAEVVFKDGNTSELTLTALTNIEKDEEITICYLDDCQRKRSRCTRQKILRENYLFTCTCAKCVLEMGDESSSSEQSESDMDDDIS